MYTHFLLMKNDSRRQVNFASSMQTIKGRPRRNGWPSQANFENEYVLGYFMCHQNVFISIFGWIAVFDNTKFVYLHWFIISFISKDSLGVGF